MKIQNRSIVGWLVVLVIAHAADAQNVLNRIVSTDIGPAGGRINFTDVDSGAVTSYPIPNGYLPGYRVAMDKNGDVWLDDANTFQLRKFTSTGQLVATVNHPNQAYWLTTDSQANLIVGSSQFPLLNGVFLHKYSPTGQLLQVLNLGSLVPGGVLTNFQGGAPGTFPWGVIRMLVTRNGDLWVAIREAAPHAIFKLDSNWNLIGTWAVLRPSTMLPDNGDGVWIGYSGGHGQSPNMPGIPNWGWVHLDGAGTVVYSSPNAGMVDIYPLYGQIRSDGYHFSPNIGIIAGAVHYSLPSNPGAYTGLAPLPPTTSMGYDGRAGIHLDCNQRMWVLQHDFPVPAVPSWSWARYYWRRLGTVEPFPIDMQFNMGNLFTFPVCCGAIPQQTWFASTCWGQTTLYEFALYTDPLGDLDSDGLPNQQELLNFTNPCNALSPAAQVLASVPPPGGLCTIGYTVLGNAGFPYFAPFSLSNAPTTLWPGVVLPFPLGDPLVQESLAPSFPWINGTIGMLDIGGQSVTSLQIPALPVLSGLTFYTSILTVNPLLPAVPNTISTAFPLLIP